MSPTSSKNDPTEIWAETPIKNRVIKSIAVPITAAVTIFTICVAIAIAIVMFQPKSVTGTETFQNGEVVSTADSDLGGGAIELKGAESELDDRQSGSSGDSLITSPSSSSNVSAENVYSEGDSSNEWTNQDSKTADETVIFVHVVGEVTKPGVVELKKGDRVKDAIEKAGGVSAGAVLELVNLAREVADGEQILVPNENTDPLHLQAQASQPGQSDQPHSTSVQINGVVNLNSADQAALETLPRVGPKMAEKIIQWRTDNGGFGTVEDLMLISGIGPKVFAELQDRVTI